VAVTNTLAYYGTAVESLFIQTPGGQCYKTVFVRNCKCPWQVLPAYTNVYGVRPGDYPRVEYLRGASVV
jgi:hypothetical protein